MSDLRILAHLAHEYDIAKREHLAAWAAVHGDLLAIHEDQQSAPSLQALLRLARAQAHRSAVEAKWAALMEAEEQTPRDCAHVQHADRRDRRGVAVAC